MTELTSSQRALKALANGRFDGELVGMLKIEDGAGENEIVVKMADGAELERWVRPAITYLEEYGGFKIG